MMRFSAAKPRDVLSDASTIPLINVVLLMLIFLLVAGTLRQFDDGGIVPPAAERDPQGNIAGERVIHLHADGRLTLRGDVLGIEQIAGLLSGDTVDGQPDTVWLMADRDIDAQAGIKVLRGLKAAGLGEIELIVRSGRGA